ncbi:glycosyltransferase family 4 protein [Roseibacillus persicicus]|uniref:glycosyltransferase family 4 protein n=1 Tax=Roseibacillus persicicus TaxID=454148 RepID=UPI00398B0DFC
MNNTARTLLVIGYVWPEPNSSAAGGHLLSLMHLFQSNGWQIHFASPAARGEHECDLTEEGISSSEIALNCSSFDTFVAELNPTAVLFDRFMMEEQFGWRVAQACPAALRILDMEDFHSLRQARHEAVKKGQNYRDADLFTEKAQREVAAIFRCDLSLVISEFERDLLVSSYQVPEELLVWCPFLLEPFTGRTPAYSEREHLISIGNFRHAPNWDAVLWLKREIWPKIRKELSEVELHVYGAYPPPKAMPLHQPREGFLVKGWAVDSRAVMARARLCVAPLRFGAGLKGKLTEAMLCGTPSVTTAVGAEGIQGSLPWPGAVAEEPKEFARQVVALYRDEREWQLRQTCGYELLEQRFHREKIGRRVLEQVESCLRNLQSHRRRNFIGQMLQHQTMKATQYMSQWIEAKNRQK